MKKRISYIFLAFMFLIFLLSTTVNATTINSNDVESRTYIIGEHMYTRETNGDYKGSLTTQYIMYGSSTIESKDIQDFIIYYKNPLGEWKNALTNETVTAPETFNIKYKNGEQIAKPQYGDVYCDGLINGSDVSSIMRYLAGYEMQEQVQIENADVNGDGRITEADVVLLRKYIVDRYPNANLPEEPLGKTYIINYETGSSKTDKIDYELEGHTLIEPNDPEKDGYIFDGWYVDEEYTTKFDFDNMKITENITIYAKFVKPQYGDVNCDGNVTVRDLSTIMNYLAGYEISEDCNIKNADVNNDGRITKADEKLLAKYLVGDYPNKNLPNESLGKSYIIEYVTADLGTYEIDFELEGYTLSNNQKPEDPEKQGYVFDGWYLDKEYTTKFEFNSMKITENTVLYAKFVEPQYGDANGDGTIDTEDVIYIMTYLEETDIPEDFNIINADVNNDGRITKADEKLLAKYISGYYPEANLPAEPLGKTYRIEYVLDNTSTFDTYEVDYELEGHKVFAPDEPEKEGYVFEGWYYLMDDKKFDFDTTVVTRNIELYANFVKPLYGDVNCDGEVTEDDATYLLYHTMYPDEYELTAEGKINADVNIDGTINSKDVTIIQNHLKNEEGYETLPYNP